MLSSRSIDSFLLGVMRLHRERERGSEKRCRVVMKWFLPFIRCRCVYQQAATLVTC